MIRFQKTASVLICAWLTIVLAGCSTVGRDFPSHLVPKIKIGQTTQAEIRSMFGSPWRVGIEDGQHTWTYGKYQYRMLGDASTRDLVVRFDERQVVASYTFNTTEHDQ